ncbi:MAG: hypothetical protein K6B13_01390 [Prevotella sp.]|nr:hypothetical protein [Prevotella sp.]
MDYCIRTGSAGGSPATGSQAAVASSVLLFLSRPSFLFTLRTFRPKPSDEKSEAFGQRVRSLRTECPKPSDFFGDARQRSKKAGKNPKNRALSLIQLVGVHEYVHHTTSGARLRSLLWEMCQALLRTLLLAVFFSRKIWTYGFFCVLLQSVSMKNGMSHQSTIY